MAATATKMVRARRRDILGPILADLESLETNLRPVIDVERVREFYDDVLNFARILRKIKAQEETQQ